MFLNNAPPSSAPTGATNVAGHAVKPRIQVIDALRGLAVLGILIMNIQSFAMPDAAYLNPMAFGVSGSITESANGWAYIFSHLFADQKFMTIFSLLFGFSMALMFDSGRQHPHWFLCKRNALLLLIGCVHAYLIWHGDILVTYALCGFVLVWLLRLSTPLLVSTGCFLLLVPVLTTVSSYYLLPYWSASEIAALQEIWQPGVAAIQNEIEQMRGSWWQQLPLRFEKAIELQVYLFPSETGWRVIGLMLWGAALHRSGWFQQAHSSQLMALRASLLLAAGLALTALGIQQNEVHQWQADYSLFIVYLFNYIGSVLVAFAYIGLFYVGYQVMSASLLMHCLQAVGRTALSNYLLQSMICSWLFYGHGLGWFAMFDRVGQWLLLPLIWSVQIVLTLFWLKYFKSGPVEWLWRSGVEGRLLTTNR